MILLFRWSFLFLSMCLYLSAAPLYCLYSESGAYFTGNPRILILHFPRKIGFNPKSPRISQFKSCHCSFSWDFLHQPRRPRYYVLDPPYLWGSLSFCCERLCSDFIRIRLAPASVWFKCFPWLSLSISEGLESSSFVLCQPSARRKES